MGIAPQTLRDEVQSTAAWALQQDTPASRALKTEPEGEVAYFRMQMAAHYTTLDTFVPTNVDSRIRFHTWQETNDEKTFAEHVAVLEEVHSWPVSAVSNRTVQLGDEWLAGHYGEWNSIRAGARKWTSKKLLVPLLRPGGSPRQLRHHLVDLRHAIIGL